MAQSRPLDINILPQRYRPAQVQSSVSIGILVGAALLFGLMPAYAFFSRERRDTAVLEARLEQVQADLAQSQAGAGELESVVKYGADSRRQKTIINSSRQVLYASKGKDFAGAARQVAQELRDNINRCLSGSAA